MGILLFLCHHSFVLLYLETFFFCIFFHIISLSGHLEARCANTDGAVHTGAAEGGAGAVISLGLAGEGG